MIKGPNEDLSWHCRVQVEKFDEDSVKWAQDKSGLLTPSADQMIALGVKPYETVVIDPGNQLLDTSPATGMEHFMKSIFTTGTRNYQADTTHCGIGVGDSSTADAGTETGLLAATNRLWMPQDTGYPTIAVNTGVVSVKASFSAANYAWNEYGVCIPNQTSAPTAISANAVAVPTGYAMLNRKAPASLGTKTSGTWAISFDITIT